MPPVRPSHLVGAACLSAFFLLSGCRAGDGIVGRLLPDRLGTVGSGGDSGAPDEGPGWDTGASADSGASDSGDTGAPSDDGGAGEDVRVVIAPDYLNLRDGPSGSDAVVRALGCGAEVVVLGAADGSWLPVRGDGAEGWVKERYLVPVADAPDDPCPGPDAYLDDTPGRVEELLSVTPYVEQSCRDTTWEGWPFEAQRCTYNGGLVVTVADPSPEQVTAWIADASQLIPALWSLEERDRDAWKDGLEIIASHTLYQSSRIFPLEGEIDEGYVYDFDRGVTEGCSTGCYCRINSTTRQQWCEYADEVLGLESEGDCLAEYSTTTFTDAWAEHCLDVHRAAWTGVHQHYRAMAWWANKSVAAAFPDPDRADPEAVVDLLRALY